ncbi:MFS transporter [Roseomonas sp. PWR1]|uniref:MFS transporter n=1 Tax=Roseomonas nitratireducens TaxID=2820810 RepID=A0ABS4AS36_9PROT|nr:MFS transporter [Neoroseomonas nitratireducens]MBP0464161.1 MFS transporter [Neoroseomonas nitratireducens]
MADAALIDSPAAWRRLGVALLLSAIGSVPMWAVVVMLPAVQAEFGTARADASLPYTMTMVGFVAGGVLMGRLSDRFGVMVPVLIGAVALGLGGVAAAMAPGILAFGLAYGLLLGCFGAAAVFGPLIADVSLWFAKRRGIAVALAASGNYVAGTIWPPLLQWGVQTIGWRHAHLAMGVFCVATMLPLAFALRRRLPLPAPRPAAAPGAAPERVLGLSPNGLQMALTAAGIACCVAMAMPQVHIVAYCVDLGYGAQRGAEMLSLMLACGIVSRLVFGVVMDRIGGLATLALGSALQGVALLLFLPADGMVALYVVSAVFGLFQGGIVPSYAMIVRENFPPSQAGTRVGIALSSTLVGMALGGWMAGAIFDATGSYDAAMWNGIAWNLVNLAIALWLLQRGRRFRGTRPAFA